MARRLIVGPRSDAGIARWPVMLLDSATPGLIRGGMSVSTPDELHRLAAEHDADIEVSAAAREQLPDGSGWAQLETAGR